MLFKELNEKYDIEYLLIDETLNPKIVLNLYFQFLRVIGVKNLTPDTWKIQSSARKIHMNICNTYDSNIMFFKYLMPTAKKMLSIFGSIKKHKNFNYYTTTKSQIIKPGRINR